MSEPIDRNLAFDLVRATEAAAMNAARWMGRGDKNAADGAAVEALRATLNSIDMDGVVIIGEGEKDEAPMLFNGEHVGNGNTPAVDVAVDPIDGTTLLAKGLPNAISCVAVAAQGTLLDPKGIFYMDKLAVGPAGKGRIDINAPVSENLNRVAQAKGYRVEDLTVVMLDRPRNQPIMEEIRKAGARIMMIEHGDIAGGLMPALEGTGIDLLMGIGGAPEAVVVACALKAVGGDMQCKLWPRNEQERQEGEARDLDFNRVYNIDDMVATEDVFFAATGVTDGELLRGVRYEPNGARTQSLVMRGVSGTVRYVDSRHNFERETMTNKLVHRYRS